MEKKNNKKLFAIIGGSVLAFILTIALSVSITLAYFGQSAKGTTTISMGNPVNVGAPAVKAGTDLTGMLPAEEREITITGKVSSIGTGVATDALIRFAASATAGEGFDAGVTNPVTFEVTSAKVGTQTYAVSDVTDGYYYLLATDNTNCAVITDLGTEKDIELVVTVTANSALTNTSANKTITVDFEVGAAQADINGDTEHTPSEAAEYFTAAPTA